jgi:hypothetical protein
MYQCINITRYCIAMEHNSIQTALPEFIENVKNKKYNLHFNSFEFACLFNDTLLKDYIYSPLYDDTKPINHIWINKKDHSKITHKDIRIFINEQLFQLFDEFHNKLLTNYGLNINNEYEQEQSSRLIKFYAGQLLGIKSGRVYFKLLEYLPQL